MRLSSSPLSSHAILTALCLSLACSSEPDANSGESLTTAEATSSAGSESSSQSGSEESTASSGTDDSSSGDGDGDGDDDDDSDSSTDTSDTGPVLDVGAGETGSTEAGDGSCEALDFLFVIDSSSTMFLHQAKLQASFGPFIELLESTLDTVETLHIGVITADAYLYNATSCQALGNLVTETDGGSIAQGPMATPPNPTVCSPFAEGNRYMTEMDDLATTFACAAGVGSYSFDYERPITGAVEALSDAMNAPGACNEGFLRTNAPLVVIMLTDDMSVKEEADDLLKEDSDPTKDTSLWKPAFLDAKSGDESAIVVVGFAPYGDQSCIESFGTGVPNVADFVQSFEHHVIASICVNDYAATMQAAVDEIKTSCDEFIPPG